MDLIGLITRALCIQFLMFALLHDDRLVGVQRELSVEPLAPLFAIKVSLQRSVQFTAYLSLTNPATLCPPEEGAAT